MEINTATKITIFRMFLIPLIILVLIFPYSIFNVDTNLILFNQKMYLPYFISLIIFTIASITDAVDGYIARKTNTITTLGKFLDPIADKLLVNTLLIYLAFQNNFNVIFVILMISRDTIVDSLRFVAASNNVVIAASLYGKLKTIFQMITIILILLFAIPNQELTTLLYSLTLITTLISLVSGYDYLIKTIKYLK